MMKKYYNRLIGSLSKRRTRLSFSIWNWWIFLSSRGWLLITCLKNKQIPSFSTTACASPSSKSQSSTSSSASTNKNFARRASKALAYLLTISIIWTRKARSSRRIQISRAAIKPSKMAGPTIALICCHCKRIMNRSIHSIKWLISHKR